MFRFSSSFLELRFQPWQGRLHSALLCVKQVDNGTSLAISPPPLLLFFSASGHNNFVLLCGFTQRQQVAIEFSVNISWLVY